MVREEGSSRWEFFFDGVKGFDFEPGFIYTLEVRLEDRDPIYRMWGDMPITLLR